MWLGNGQMHEIVAFLGLDFAGLDGRQLQVRHPVHAYLDPRFLAKCFQLALKFFVRGGHEVRPCQELQRLLLRHRWWGFGQ